ncbi:MAG: hypothetical protein KTR30_30595 [Saprospiraceae bacterium]|nr:hypothetical protein [Saprospiraceae bacterium]
MRLHNIFLGICILCSSTLFAQEVEPSKVADMQGEAPPNDLNAQFYRTQGELKLTPLPPLPEEVSNMEARFYRPSLLQQKTEKGTFSMGGYAEANTQYFLTEGEGEGLHLQFRQLHLFAQSNMLNDRLHFIADVGFDPVNQQFNLTEAAVKVKFHSAINFRAGVILPPLGYFNQNADSPVLDLIDQPISSTRIIPSRLSEVGFGFNGHLPFNETFEITYELYAVNGLQDGVVDNDLPRTAIDLGKTGNLFGADNNDKLAYTGRIGLHRKNFAEVGFSYYRGVYNTIELDEIEIDVPRALSIMAVDARLKVGELRIKAEGALANVDVYDGLGQLFGEKQLGYHVEMSYPVLQHITLLGQDDNQLRLAVRYELTDYNVDNFEQTETEVFDDIMGFRAGLALRFSQTAVIKANYCYFWEKDILGNASEIGGIQLGIASYF